MFTVADLVLVHGLEVERLKRVPVVTVLSDVNMFRVDWHDVARVVGVSFNTVAGWRSGAVVPTSKEWERLVCFAACLDVLSGPAEGSGGAVLWLKSHVMDGVFVSGMDLLSVGRKDLVFDLASGIDPGQVLDSLDSTWQIKRTTFE